MTDNYDNPYVGPRTFTRREAARFFGRDQEAAELRSLILTERLVLFYAQSGAGKSSLINARLIPSLQEAGFAVLPVGRIGGELPGSIGPVANPFVYNLLLGLDGGHNPPERFTRMALTDFLPHLTSPDGERYYFDDSLPVDDITPDAAGPRYILIIDQFEELFTTHLHHWPEREAFFTQLNDAMRADPLLWVVLTLREDYLAALDPYAPLLRDKLRARYYMQRMGYEAAMDAVQKPAANFHRPFAPGVAKTLVDNLRQVRLPGQTAPQPGQYVEPVQLQVVCYQLWENLKEQPPSPITAEHLQQAGDVDTALAKFYEDALARAAAHYHLPENDLRLWFEQKLITEAGTRGMAFKGSHDTAGLPNPAVNFLADLFILRAEVRAGGAWYELVHDRFVEPIIQSNRAWRDHRLQQSPLIQAAQAWLDSGQDPARLLTGAHLAEALKAAAAGPPEPLVHEFLAAGQEAEQERELEATRQQAARLRRIAAILILAFIVSLLFALYAQNRQTAAQKAQTIAELERATAEAAKHQAVAQQATTLAEAQRAANAEATAQAQVTIARQTEGTAVAARIIAENVLATLEANLQAQLDVIASPVSSPTPVASPIPLPGVTEPAGPTATATPSPSPTIDRPATATFAALAAQLAQVQATKAAIGPAPGQWAVAFGGDVDLAGAQFEADKAAQQGYTPTIYFRSASQRYVITVGPYLTRLAAQTELEVVMASLASDAIIVDLPVWCRLPQIKAGFIECAAEAVVAPTATRTPTRPAQLVFVQGGSPTDAWRHALAVISDQGVLQRQLVLYAGAPAWSPGGEQIAFIAEPGITTQGGVYAQGGPGLWQIGVDGRNPRQMIRSEDIKNLGWSPDGTKLAYELQPPGQDSQVIIVDARDGRRIAQFSGEQPAWHPNSQQLAIRSCLPNCGLWQINFDGGQKQPLTTVGTDFFPNWSPNGQYLTFTSSARDGNWEIYRLRLADGQLLRLTNRPGSDITPVFSPDSLEIYFRTDAFGGWRLYAVTVDGRAERQVKEGVGPSDNWGMARPAVR